MDDNVRSYDETTMFSIAGMQQYKPLFNDTTYKGTKTNIQSCLRLNDLSEIGDGTHLLYFNMLGLFSFREMSVQQSVDFWMEFLNKIGIKPDYVTIHPDKPDWVKLYSNYEIEVRLDEGCIWSDGENSGGYCTEFYKDDIEIGNIVNPLGDCIDCGFGSERLHMVLTSEKKSTEETLIETIHKIIESGFTPTYNKQGSILRKLLRMCYLKNIIIDHPFYEQEILRQEKILNRYNNLKDKHKDKDRNWWMSTHGIDIDLINGVN